MRLILAIITSLLIASSSLLSQSLSVFDIDTTNFPTMKAKFYAFDASGNQIKNLSPSDFEVIENGTARTVTNVTCPNSIPVVVSSVLVFDMSGSMSSGPPRIESAKKAANAWINGLPTGQSECALVSFDDQSMILHDFTKDRTILKNSIAQLQPRGGTDYNQALIDLPCGGLNIAKSGKNKRVLIFLTDGQPNYEPRTQEIINFAKQYQITIYAVTLDMPAPQCIKDMTKQTGGQYFENITTQQEAELTYQKLLQLATSIKPCEITWQGGVFCFAGITNAELRITNIGLTDNASYQSPNTSVAKLEFSPTYIKFAAPQVGVKTEQKVTVTARNSDFTITNITINNGAFDITPKNFVLNAGQSIELTVSYFPADSGYNYCKFEFENNLLCPAKYYVNGGWIGKKPTFRTIKLIHPNGGQVFVAGSDTVITWEGVSPDQPVKLEYRTDDNQPWVTITDSAKGLSHKFKVPKIASKKYLARVIVKSETFDNEMVVIPAGTFQMGNTGAYSGTSLEKPVHTVTISRNFLMSKYEITQKQFEKVMKKNPSVIKGENLPVQKITWNSAVEFCNKLSDIEGLERCYTVSGASIVCNWDASGYRLPTEAEWEYACKAGTATDLYSGHLTYPSTSPIDPKLDRIAWYISNCGNKIHPVGQKEPNLFGLYDMIGNVSEFCWDWWNLFSAGTVTDPKGPSFANGSNGRIVRGGSWSGDAIYCRSSIRGFCSPDDIRPDNIGFRIVSTR